MALFWNWIQPVAQPVLLYSQDVAKLGEVKAPWMRLEEEALYRHKETYSKGIHWSEFHVE